MTRFPSLRCIASWTRLAGAAALGLALGACGGGSGPDSVGALRLIGQVQIPTKTQFQGVEFGGISALDRAPDGSYWALSDERGGERGTPRFYKLAMDLDLNSFKSVQVHSMVYLRGPDGLPMSSTSRTVDPEGLRVAPNGKLYISSEGNWSTNPAQMFQPFVREFNTDGSHVRQFETPAAFNYVDNSTRGGRSNKLFEALAVTPSGQIFTANEDALIEDGPITSLNAGSVIRVVQLDPVTGKTVAQYAYALPKIPVAAAANARFAPDNGLPELLAVSEREFIAVERAFADGVGNTIRLVRTRIEADSTDVSRLTSLVGARYTPMTREVLLEMPITYQGVKLDNIEGLSWGPVLANGHRSLVLVADNNFDDSQSTQFLAFEVLPK